MKNIDAPIVPAVEKPLPPDANTLRAASSLSLEACVRLEEAISQMQYHGTELAPTRDGYVVPANERDTEETRYDEVKDTDLSESILVG